MVESHTFRPARRRTLVRSGLALLLLACSETPLAPVPLQIEIVAGDAQEGFESGATFAPLVVRVTEVSGAALEGIEVHWLVLEGAVGLTSSVTTTGPDGTASVVAVLGREAGPVLVLAQVEGEAVRFRLSIRRTWKAVTTGQSHTCALSGFGEAYCWGSNWRAQLGDDSETARDTPTPVVGNIEFSSLSAGWQHTCGIDRDGSLFCWGNNDFGQIGVGDQTFLKSRPNRVDLGERVLTVSAGYLHTCAITHSGALFCWGSNVTGSVGSSPDACSGEPCALLPQRVIWDEPFKVVAAGEFHSCAVEESGGAICWGWNSSGELGTGQTPGAQYNSPQRVAGSEAFDQITAHARHTCARSTVGKVWCWGRSGRGELGGVQFAWAPVPLGPEFTVNAISTGSLYTCLLLREEGGAACYGDQADLSSSTVPRIFAAPDFDQIAVGHSHTCGIADRGVWCWGANTDNQVAPDPRGSFVPDPIEVVF